VASWKLQVASRKRQVASGKWKVAELWSFGELVARKKVAKYVQQSGAFRRSCTPASHATGECPALLAAKVRQHLSFSAHTRQGQAFQFFRWSAGVALCGFECVLLLESSSQPRLDALRMSEILASSQLVLFFASRRAAQHGGECEKPSKWSAVG